MPTKAPSGSVGPVARELLRISGMSFAMRRDTPKANAANIGPELRRLAAQLEAAADAMARDDVDGLAPAFRQRARLGASDPIVAVRREINSSSVSIDPFSYCARRGLVAVVLRNG